MADNIAEGTCIGCGRSGFGYGLCRDCLIASESEKMIDQAARTADRITATAILDLNTVSRLAAAAPELLAALKACIAELACVVEKSPAGTAARALIARLEGK